MSEDEAETIVALRGFEIEKLKAEIERLRKGWKKEADKDCKWALKEIERLQADLKSEREAHQVCVQMRNDAETDNKRLRAGGCRLFEECPIEAENKQLQAEIERLRTENAELTRRLDALTKAYQNQTP